MTVRSGLPIFSEVLFRAVRPDFIQIKSGKVNPFRSLIPQQDCVIVPIPGDRAVCAGTPRSRTGRICHCDARHIFNGADTQNPPFAIETVTDPTSGETKHYLTYRNVRVDDASDSPYYDEIYEDANGNHILDKDGNPIKNRDALALFNGDSEHLYVDIGIGFEVDKDGNVISSTAFDSAISGLEFIGGGGVDGGSHPGGCAGASSIIC